MLKISESADGDRLEYHWEEPGAAAWATIEVCDGELSADFVERANSRGGTVIFAKNGWTEGAEALARRYWINLEAC